MWYVAVGDDADKTRAPSARWRAAYAESDDGVRWIKPNLGLVEYVGSTNNNLIATDPAPLGFVKANATRISASAPSMSLLILRKTFSAELATCRGASTAATFQSDVADCAWRGVSKTATHRSG